MPATTKTPGFMTDLKLFVPSAIADTGALLNLQKEVDAFVEKMAKTMEAAVVKREIVPTRR